MQRLGRYLLANTVRAGVLALACELLPWPFSMMAAVMVGLITLSKGAQQGLYMLSWVVLPVVAATWKAPTFAIAYDIAFIVCLFSFVLASLLRLVRNWSRLLELSLALGLVYVSVIQALPRTLILHVTSRLEHLITDNLVTAMPSDAVALKDMVHSLSPYLLGSLYTAFALVSILLVMLARLWQLQLSSPGDRRMEFYSIRIDRRVAVMAGAIMVATCVWQLDWMVTLTQLMTLPFIFSGMSFLVYVGKLTAREPKALRWVLLVLCLVVLLLLPRFLLLGLAAIGFADSCINFRKLHLLRIKRVSS